MTVKAKRAKRPKPTFGEFTRNPGLAAAWAEEHPDQAREFVLVLCKLAALAPRLEQGAAIAEWMSRHDPELYAALADMPGPAVLRIADAARSASSATAAAKKPAPAWHAAAKREAARLIKQGINPRNVASKLACLPQFSTYTLRTIRNALR